MAGAVSCDTIQVDRKRLLEALKRIQRVVPRNSTKPILTGVRMETHRGVFRLNATDIEYGLTVTLDVKGDLDPCVAGCVDLINRMKSSKQSDCSLTLDQEQGVLLINGGAIEHQLPTMDVSEFPALVKSAAKSCWAIRCQELRRALGVALLATAREPSRYAINGVLLEIEATDARFVATDGRRLVTVELEHQEGTFEGKLILPSRAAELLGKLIGPKDDHIIAVSISKATKKQPSSLQVASPDWRLAFEELEGEFPRYHDVIPKSGTQFSVDRKQVLEVLAEVALATDLEHRAVRIDVDQESVRISAGGTGAGRSIGEVNCKLLGGDSQSIVTGFNPKSLTDAFKSLDEDRVILDLNPGKREHNQIVGKPALIYGESSLQIRWVIMPVCINS